MTIPSPHRHHPRRLVLLVVIALTASVAVPLRGASTTIVISQVYGGGGNSGATLSQRFHRALQSRDRRPSMSPAGRCSTRSSTGSTWQKTDLSGVIPPGRFYLVQEAAGSAGTIDLPAPDAVGTIAMAAGSGKVALVSSTTLLSGACPSSAVVDIVGYGSANCFETAPAPALSNTTAAVRARQRIDRHR